MGPSENALLHWNKHSGDFPEYKNASEYVEGAKRFVQNASQDLLRKSRSNGDNLFYDPPSNTFAVMNSEGNLKTMFKPSAGIRYWEKQ